MRVIHTKSPYAYNEAADGYSSYLDIEIPADLAILRANCTPVAMDKPTLETLVADMIETMDAVDGVGLAAPQVGITQRLVVIRIPSATRKTLRRACGRNRARAVVCDA
jgi:peptide deformylase